MPGETFFVYRLDSFNIDPEPSVISLILGVGINLGLNPLDRSLVLVDILSIRVREPTGTVTVAGEPNIVAIVSLAVPSGSNIGVEV